MLGMTDLAAYVLHRVMSRDVAEANGQYASWPDVDVDLTEAHAQWLASQAGRFGVSTDDLLAALVRLIAERMPAGGAEAG